MDSIELGRKVWLAMSGEAGVCIGVAKYLYEPDSYYVRYIAADGRQCECWFKSSALSLVSLGEIGEKQGSEY